MTSVKVAVRVRPFNKLESKTESKRVIIMEGNTTKTIHPQTGEEKLFTFDYSYWSHDGYLEDPDTGYLYPEDDKSEYADQARVFNDMVSVPDNQGKMVIENAFQGFHTCLFAYGQTGAGKSYSVVGYNGNRGIVPRACDQIFNRIDEMSSANRQFAVQVSMLQIYNEIVHDLFTHPSNRTKGGLEVRQDNSGPFVKELTHVPVNSYNDIDRQIQRGNTNRTIGATNMNTTSSRAHTIVAISIKQTILNESKMPVHTLNTKINLVDLAGSERIAATGAVGGRLKEGTNINKSLSVLGKVISCLAQKSQGKAKSAVVPYRESKLTRILQNNLGGNSKTAMIAAISPASVNYEETLSTLRYAYQVKSIKNKAFLNESPLDRVVRELRNENKALRRKLDDGLVGSEPIKFEEPEWKGRYHLKNLNQDPLLTGKIRHVLEDGITRIGQKGDVEVGGLGVVSQHCRIELDQAHNEAMLVPNDSSLKHQTLVNGKLVTEPIRLKHNDRVRFGLHNYFVYLAPGETEDEQYNWEYANKEAVDNNVKEIEAKSHLETLELKAKLQELEGLMKEKAEIEEEIKRKLELMENDHQKRMGAIRGKYAKLMESAESDEQQRLKEKLDAELNELEATRKENERIMQLQNQELLQALRLKERSELEKQLRDMLVKINLMNEVCQLMGKYSYLYEPHIDIQIGQNGEKKPKVVCRAYPDVNNRSVYNSFDYGDLVNLYYNIMQRWEDYLYDEQPDPQDRYIFGMDISEYWKHLGNSHLFLNGIYNLVDTPYDITPIMEKGGKPNGNLHYSLIPHIYHKQKDTMETQSIMKYDSLDDVEDGRNFGFDLVIESAKGLPPQYCYKTFARYKLFGQVCETDIVLGGTPVTSDPQFSFKKNFKFKMNQEIRNKLKNGVLVVDVYGQLEQQEYMRLKSKLDKQKEEEKGKGKEGDKESLNKSENDMPQGTTRRQEEDQEIAKLMVENEKLRVQLQKGSGYGKRNSCCCIIF